MKPIITPLVGLLAAGALALAAPAAQAKSCEYESSYETFPHIQDVKVTGGSCDWARAAAIDIEYRFRHGQKYPKHIRTAPLVWMKRQRFSCTYSKVPTGGMDEFFPTAKCTAGRMVVRMVLAT